MGLPAVMATGGPVSITQNVTLQHSLEITLQNVGVLKARNITVRAYVNGGDMITLAEARLLPGQGKLLISYAVKTFHITE